LRCGGYCINNGLPLARRLVRWKARPWTATRGVALSWRAACSPILANFVMKTIFPQSNTKATAGEMNIPTVPGGVSVTNDRI